MLVTGAAQLLYLDVPDHAAVDLSIRLLQIDGRTERYRRPRQCRAPPHRPRARRDPRRADPLDDDTPDWLRARWIARYGEAEARAIAAAHAHEPAVDLTVKADPARWAETLDAHVLPTGSLRLRQRAPLPTLPGYVEGDWWVQDAAAALPARLLAVQPGERVADLCAAPGGKTAQLAAAGAPCWPSTAPRPAGAASPRTWAACGWTVETRAVDALALEETGFDAVLLDAPCSSTGTLRRHPDVAWTKASTISRRLADLQRRLLGAAARDAEARRPARLLHLLAGAEEGEAQIRGPPRAIPEFRARARPAGRTSRAGGAITGEGDVRTLPTMLPHEDTRLAGSTVSTRRGCEAGWKRNAVHRSGSAKPSPDQPRALSGNSEVWVRARALPVPGSGAELSDAFHALHRPRLDPSAR